MYLTFVCVSISMIFFLFLFFFSFSSSFFVLFYFFLACLLVIPLPFFAYLLRNSIISLFLFFILFLLFFSLANGRPHIATFSIEIGLYLSIYTHVYEVMILYACVLCCFFFSSLSLLPLSVSIDSDVCLYLFVECKFHVII